LEGGGVRAKWGGGVGSPGSEKVKKDSDKSKQLIKRRGKQKQTDKGRGPKKNQNTRRDLMEKKEGGSQSFAGNQKNGEKVCTRKSRQGDRRKEKRVPQKIKKGIEMKRHVARWTFEEARGKSRQRLPGRRLNKAFGNRGQEVL